MQLALLLMTINYLKMGNGKGVALGCCNLSPSGYFVKKLMGKTMFVRKTMFAPFCSLR